MPESFFVLSKENLEIAIDEITAIAKMYDRFSKIKIISNLVIIQSKLIGMIYQIEHHLLKYQDKY